MAAPSKNFNAPADGQIDAESPVDVTLMTQLRDSLVHLEEWLGMSYTAAQNHDHDGVNSALSAGVLDGSVTYGKLAFNATIREVTAYSGITVSSALQLSMATMTLTPGTEANGDSTDGAWLASTVNNGYFDHYMNERVRRDWYPIFYAKIKTYSVVTNTRMWHGFDNNGGANATDTPSANIAMFRFISGGTKWYAVTTDNAGTATLTDTGITVAASTVYELRIVCGASDVKFYINNVLVATNTTNIPAATALMYPYVGLGSFGAVGGFSLSRVVVAHK